MCTINAQSLFLKATRDRESGKVKAYAQVGQESCIIKLLDKYLAKLPPGSPSFYMQPAEKCPVTGSGSWYTKQRVGISNLKKIITVAQLNAQITHCMQHRH